MSLSVSSDISLSPQAALKYARAHGFNAQLNFIATFASPSQLAYFSDWDFEQKTVTLNINYHLGSPASGLLPFHLLEHLNAGSRLIAHFKLLLDWLSSQVLDSLESRALASSRFVAPQLAFSYHSLSSLGCQLEQCLGYQLVLKLESVAFQGSETPQTLGQTARLGHNTLLNQRRLIGQSSISCEFKRLVSDDLKTLSSRLTEHAAVIFRMLPHAIQRLIALIAIDPSSLQAFQLGAGRLGLSALSKPTQAHYVYQREMLRASIIKPSLKSTG